MVRKIKIIISTLLIALALKLVGCSPLWVIGPSMYPTFIQGKSLLLVLYIDKTPDRGEIAIIDRGELKLCKRIVAVPGDVVEMYDDVITVNGEDATLVYNAIPDHYKTAKFTLLPGYYFVIGENRPNSMDSRDLGPILRSEIVGTLGPYIVIFEEGF